MHEQQSRDGKPSQAPWEANLPAVLGALPLGGRLVRTDPRGPTPAPIAIIGLYPALTTKRQWPGPRGRWLPTAVEERSFEGSSSATELEEKYFRPLGLSEARVFLIDLYPYYLANAATGKSGRTMWDNVVAYQEATNEQLAVRCRPDDDEMVEWCRKLEGNRERLAWWFARCQPRLAITLGREAAAFARGYEGRGAARRAQDHLYREPFESTAFGPAPVRVVHCAHPGLLMREHAGRWNDLHGAWCAGDGAREVQRAMACPAADDARQVRRT
jgi:hypothetical protein